MYDTNYTAGGDRRRDFDLVILDFDGTLVDTRDDIVEGINQALDDLGLPRRPLPEIAAFIGRGVEHLATRSLPPDRDDLLQPMLERFRAHYDECFDRSARLYPGVRATLEVLRRHGILLAIASNKPSTYVSRLLGKFGLGACFAAAVGGDLMVRKKPDPWCIDEIRRSCSVPAGRTLMVGDMRYDMETGVNAGVRACGVLYGYGSAEELRRAGAQHLLETFPKLAALVRGPVPPGGSPPRGVDAARRFDDRDGCLWPDPV